MMSGPCLCQRHGWHRVRDYGTAATARIWSLPGGRWGAEVQRPFDHPARRYAEFATLKAARAWADHVAITGDDVPF